MTTSNMHVSDIRNQVIDECIKTVEVLLSEYDTFWFDYKNPRGALLDVIALLTEKKRVVYTSKKEVLEEDDA